MKKIMKKVIAGIASVLVIMPTVAYAASNSGYGICNATKYTQYGKVTGTVSKNDQPPGGQLYITIYEKLQSNVTGTAILTLEGKQYTDSTGYNDNTAFAVGVGKILGLSHEHKYVEGISSR